jgi:hypothetical protein
VKASVVKEFSVNVTSKNLVITITPSGNSFAFLNALEVVSVPDELITDDAETFNPVRRFKGLSWQALETVHRVNMGGPTVSFEKNEYHYLFPRVYRCRMIVVIDSKSETNSKNGLNYQINLGDVPVNLSYF